MSLTLGIELIASWRLTAENFSEHAIKTLGPLLLQNGLLAPWQMIRQMLIIEGSDFEKDDIAMACSISQNAQQLLAELIQQGDQLTTTDQLRILGLLCILYSSGAEVPSNTTSNLNINREALDLFGLACLSSRNYQLAAIVAQAVNGADTASRSLDTLNSYLATLKNSLTHRQLFLTRTTLLDVTPWDEMTELLVTLRKCASLMHDQRYVEAKSTAIQLLAKYPGCPEVQWFLRVIVLQSSDSHEQLLDADPLFYYNCDLFSHGNLNLIELTDVNPSIFDQLSNALTMFNCGLDPGVERLSASYKINQLYRKGDKDKLSQFVKENSDNIISRSNYDPFDLALFAAQLSEINSIPTMSALNLPGFEDPNITFVVGMPHPKWHVLHGHFRNKNGVGTLFSDHVIKHIGERLAETLKVDDADIYNNIEPSIMKELKIFYLQNLSFVHGGKSLDLIIDLIPNSLKNIGILSILFPTARFVAVNMPTTDLILRYYTTIDGYNSNHATATLGELIAYALDYASIITVWKKLLGTRMTFLSYDPELPTSCEMICSQIINYSINNSSHQVNSFFDRSRLMEELPQFANDLEEYRDDIEEINKLLSSLDY